jgi:hypothetical protein
MPAQGEAQAGAGNRRSDTRPQRRLDPQRKVEPDPGTKEHRQPEQTALALGGEAIGDGGDNARDPHRHEADPSAHDRRIRHHRPIARVLRA